MRPTDRGSRLPVPAVLLVLAGLLVLRLFHVWKLNDPPLAGDEVAYDALGRSVASGLGYSFPPGLLYPWQADSSWTHQPTARRPPLFPLMLALGYRLGLGADGIRVVQALLAMITLACLYRTALRIGVGTRAALLAVIVFGVYPPFVAMTGLFATEGLFLSLVSAAGLLSLRALQGLRLRDFAGAGLAIGLASLARPVTLLWPVAILPLLWKLPRRAFAGWCVMAVVMALAVSPWAIRNVLVFGKFEPSFTHSGFNFYMGTMDLQLHAVVPAELEERVQGMNEFDMDRTYARAAAESIRRDPIRYLRLACLKAMEAWYFIHLPSGPWPTPKSLVGGSLLLVGTVAGLVMMFVNRLPWRWLALAMVGYFMAILMLSISGPRFSLPVIMFAAIPIGYLGDRVLEAARARLGGAQPFRPRSNSR